MYPYIEGGAWGENLGNAITVHDSLLHFYQGRKKSHGDLAPNGELSTGIDFSYYQTRVEYKAGDIANDGWMNGDPYNSGIFFHAQPGGPV